MLSSRHLYKGRSMPQTFYTAAYFVVSEFFLPKTVCQMQSPTWSQHLAVTPFQLLHNIKTGCRIVMYCWSIFFFVFCWNFWHLWEDSKWYEWHSVYGGKSLSSRKTLYHFLAMVRLSFQSLLAFLFHTQIPSKQALKALISTGQRHFPGTHS